MAKKAKARGPANSAKGATPKAPAKKSGSKKTTLGGFFRAMHKKPEVMEKFSSGPEGRAEVIDQSNLAPEHKKLLKAGCVPDIIQALAGVPPSVTAEFNMLVVQCCDEVKCGHPHCEAFSKVTAIPVDKAKSKPKPKGKKR